MSRWAQSRVGLAGALADRAGFDLALVFLRRTTKADFPPAREYFTG